ncbi:MAG: hypothetical protein QOF73_3921 [Thermomicrobiales bacterium]|jgi:hypothetical protein|nr:hypothetical protein [Thermomicrobiales bacterium]
MAGLDRDARTQLRTMIDGYQVSQAIAVAATLGIADLLADGPRGVEEVARATGAHPRSLLRLLRALAAVGVFVEVEGEGGVFGLTPIASGLRSDMGHSQRAAAMQAGEPGMWAAWGQLLHSVMTGESAFRYVHGMGAWEYRERNPVAGQLFDRAMLMAAQEVAAAIVAAYSFAEVECEVDVGGGRGVLLAEILAVYPNVRGVLFDQGHVVEAAESVLRAGGVLDRCAIEAGDFFDTVPEGGDVYVLKGVIHDWEDEDARRILESCRRVTRPGNRLLVIE